MKIPGFNAQVSLYHPQEYYQETKSVFYSDQLKLQFMFPRHAPSQTCLRKCLQVCWSDPNNYEFNDCNWSCNCECSGGLGCWQ
jgi:hypothetical protein